MKYFRKTKGAISIFLVIILVPMMTVTSLFVDAGRVKLANGLAESAGDLALNTALTEYDTKLKDLYGLFATAQDTDELYEKLESYYTDCIVSSGVVNEDADNFVDMIMAQLQMTKADGNTSDLLNMQLMDFDVSKRADANFYNASVVERQIVDFMKYRAPINTGLSFISSLKSFSTLSEQTELVDKRKEYYEEQESVMDNAEIAWSHIYKYNQEGYAKSADYLPELEKTFNELKESYDPIAKKIIMDLYDAQDYVGFNPKLYSIEEGEIEVEGKKKKIPVLYLDKEKTNKMKTYDELTTFSNIKKATADDIRKALNDYHTAYTITKTAQTQLMEYGDDTYGQQYLVQTNRRKLYETWVTSILKLYEKQTMLCHAVTYNGKNSEGKSVMTTSEKMFGEPTEHTFSEYYKWCLGNGKYDFFTVLAVSGKELKEYNTVLQKYRDNANADTEEVDRKIHSIYEKLCEYRRAVNDGKVQLEAANIYLQYIYDKIKSGGTLEQKKNNWKSKADSGSLKNTSMARQDLAEIDSLSTYLKPEDVEKLQKRLTNIIGHLQELLDQIDSYSYFGVSVTEIDDYEALKTAMGNKIGDSKLKIVPTKKQALEDTAEAYCKDQFVIGKKIDVSWRTQSGTQPMLAGNNTDKLNFYTYLYGHFNKETNASQATKTGENKKEAKDFYENTKSKSSEQAKKDADSSKNGNQPKSEEDKDTDEKEKKPQEISKISEKPSKNIGNDKKVQGFEKAETGDDAAQKNGSGLGKMLSELAAQAVNMGADLRDKLYVSDYILSITNNDKYSLAKSSAYVEIKATVQVKPVMLALPLFAKVEGNPSTKTGWYTIEYSSIKGY